jgi:hypothetical protein
MSPYDGEFDNSQRSVIWSTYLNCYVMVFTVRTSYCRISYSSDLVDWTPSQFVYGENTVGINYISLIDATLGGTDQVAGRSIWLYYTRKDYQVHRRLLTFDRQRDLAAGRPVTTSADDTGTGTALTDGDRSTLFIDGPPSPGARATTWVAVDLGSVQEFGAVVLSPADATGAGFPRDFSIEVASQAEGPWSTAARYEAYPAPRTGETQVLNLGPQQARFVRLVATGLSAVDESDRPFRLQLVSMEMVKDAVEPDATPSPAAPAGRYQASSGYSATQGANRWGYMYLARLNRRRTENWSPLEFDQESACWVSERTDSRIGPDWQCSLTKMDTARVWRIRRGAGEPRRIQIKVMKNRQRIWPKSKSWQSLSAGAALQPAALAAVNRGDRIFFIVRASAGGLGTVAWDPSVEFFPVTGLFTANSDFSDRQRDAIRTWVSPDDGIVTISGRVQRADTHGSGDLLVRVTRNRSPVWPARGWRAIQPTDTQGLTVEAAAEVRAGDRLHFRARAGGDGPPAEIIWDPTCTFHGIVPASLV